MCTISYICIQQRMDKKRLLPHFSPLFAHLFFSLLSFFSYFSRPCHFFFRFSIFTPFLSYFARSSPTFSLLYSLFFFPTTTFNSARREARMGTKAGKKKGRSTARRWSGGKYSIATKEG
mmetsp:Transcript_16323/g.41392  ORF Transcript_16323/g.41392 Transcript_16323/m.41392 type:complete len:119 (+) Transcript_16323:178-534(+)